MKHRKLNRTSAHRKALFMNLSNSLIKEERIKTTLPKAKELRPFVEKMITLGKKGDLSSRRIAISILRNEEIVAKLFNVIAKKFKDRNGGYVRILKYGFRTGDTAPMALVEFVE
jgi:large subunit ribosomal protein L17